MANTPVGIRQGDYIYYYDESQGFILSRDWYFPGGTPTGGTAFAPSIQYLTPNTSGYDARLTVTDGFVYATETKNNIIVVYPEISDFQILVLNDSGSPISASDMSSNVVFVATGGTGSGITYYSWILPGIPGFTGGSNTFTTNLYDWKDLTGSETGSPYSNFVGTAQVTAYTSLGNAFTSGSSITYNKSGVSESLNLVNYPAATGPTSHNISYFDISVLNPALSTSSIGMSGNGLLLEITQPGGTVFDNSSFHSNTEPLIYYPSSYDFPSISGQVIASYSSFSSMGISGGILSSLSGLTRYTQGRYMYPSDISTLFGGNFYFADVSNQLRNLYLDGWTTSAIESMLNETSFGSISSQNIKSYPGDTLAGTSRGFTGGFPSNKTGPCLPSGNLVGADVNMALTFFGGPTNNLNSATLLGTSVITISPNGASGNSPNGSLMVCQDTIYNGGTGIVSILNSQFASLNLTPYVGATASVDFTPYMGAGVVEPSDFNGIRIAILDQYITASKGALPFGLTSDTYLLKILISLNSISWSFDAGDMDLLGIIDPVVVNPYQWSTNVTEPRRGWYFSG